MKRKRDRLLEISIKREVDNKGILSYVPPPTDKTYSYVIKMIKNYSVGGPNYPAFRKSQIEKFLKEKWDRDIIKQKNIILSYNKAMKLLNYLV